MDLTGAGTAIMLALAAVLWFFYLMPTWFARRQYLATERNATRLQRTIRIMAETAEVPEEVRVEASAREIAERERLVRIEQRRAELAHRSRVQAELARARSASTRDALARLRLRRSRRLASLLVISGLVVGALQLWLIVQTGIVLGSWIVLGAAAASLILGARLQSRLNERALLLRVDAAPRRSTVWREPVVDAAPTRAWTPVPVPKPLYLERGEAPRVAAASVDSAALLRAAAAEAERALRAAHAEPEVVAFPTPAAPTAAPAASRYARMGIVDDADSAPLDLDEALRRRRA